MRAVLSPFSGGIGCPDLANGPRDVPSRDGSSAVDPPRDRHRALGAVGVDETRAGGRGAPAGATISYEWLVGEVVARDVTTAADQRVRRIHPSPCLEGREWPSALLVVGRDRIGCEIVDRYAAGDRLYEAGPDARTGQP